jgi:hypothetical protein
MDTKTKVKLATEIVATVVITPIPFLLLILLITFLYRL